MPALPGLSSSGASWERRLPACIFDLRKDAIVTKRQERRAGAQTGSLKSKDADRRPKSNLVIGRNSLRELLKHKAARISKVYSSNAGSSTKQGGDQVAAELIAMLNHHRIPIESCDRAKLTELAQTDSHQGFVGVLREQPEMTLTSFIESTQDQARLMVLILDSLNDPHNLGAVLRAAECFGVSAVIISKNRGTDVTPVVSKVSVGAAEIVPIIKVSNLVDAARKLSDNNFWLVAADGSAKASLNTFEFPDRTALILGSEGDGIQPLLLKQAGFTVKIPLYGQIESLNVSQAAAVLLYKWSVGGH